MQSSPTSVSILRNSRWVCAMLNDPVEITHQFCCNCHEAPADQAALQSPTSLTWNFMMNRAYDADLFFTRRAPSTCSHYSYRAFCGPNEHFWHILTTDWFVRLANRIKWRGKCTTTLGVYKQRIALKNLYQQAELLLSYSWKC